MSGMGKVAYLKYIVACRVIVLQSGHHLRHEKFIDAILQSTAHVITTVRRKTEYEMSKDGNGKTKVEKAGLKEVTRDGFEYELTVNFNLDTNHHCTTSKDRTGLFMDKPFFTITL